MRQLTCLIAVSLLFAGVAFPVLADPVVVQPSSAGYSAAELAAFSDAYQRLANTLRNQSYGPQKLLGEDGWGAASFAAFSAGSLERLGYETVIVEQATGTGSARVWVLVALDLGTQTAWVPVESLPQAGLTQKTLGTIAGTEIAGFTVRFDVAYLTYGSIVELPANMPPTAIIRPPATDIAEQTNIAWFGNASIDPDGSIVLYQWAFDGEVQRITANIAQWFTFRSSGMHTIELTVTDSRGAQDTTSLTLYVMTTEESEADCGCNK